MRHVSQFPRPVREIMTQWIVMADGCALAARIWLPIDAGAKPVPAVLEYLPYRRRDGTAARDGVTQPYLAGHGYAAVRVDIRGTGDSDGLMADEYGRPEIDDGVAVVAWLAGQPWCSGVVGMWGISWGGFNALQVAARRPPALKAIIPMGFTHDRFDGDCHFMGGCLLEGTMSWGHTFFAGLSRPPDSAVVGPDWRERWLARLAAIEPPIATWLAHQTRDAYWRPGSVCEDFSAITAAVYAVCGWQDSYSRNVLPLLEGLGGPRKGLVGPWAHAWPHAAAPGPAIGFLQEAIRWFDHWLKGIDTGIMDEPAVRVWMGEWSPPRKWMTVAPGRWIQEPTWPSPRIVPRRFALADATLVEGGVATEGWTVVRSVETLGSTAGYQNSYGLGPDLSDDQRADDALSACFDSAPLSEPLELFGVPVLDVDIACDEPQAMLAVRLCEVDGEGASLRVAYGLLNLSHRDGPAAPRPLVPGARTRIRVPLSALAHRFSPGHRIRLAVSTCYWPIAWPAPRRAAVTLFHAAGALTLPVRPSDPEGDAALAPFAEPEGAAPVALIAVRAPANDRPQDEITREPDGRVVTTRHRDRGAWRTTDTDVAYDATGTLRFSIHPDDPLSATQTFHLTTTLGRPGWDTRTHAVSRLSVTAESVVLDARLEAFEGEERVFERDWSLAFPRDHI